MQKLIDARKEKLFFYSPFNFIRSIPPVNIINSQIELISSKLDGNQYFQTRVTGFEFIFIYDFLEWDSNYFGLKSYKLVNILFECDDCNIINKACCEFKDYIRTFGSEYIYIEVPSEDIRVIQGLNNIGFKLIETRLTYYNDKIQDFNSNPRYRTRKATIDDIPNLKRVASYMRNDYDRFHADPIFGSQIGDSFLATYVEEAIKGFSDYVMIPNEEGVPSDSFLSANFFENQWETIGVKVSKMVLSAVSSSTNKGWYINLISEMSYLFKSKGITHAFMNTQSTNRQVFHTWEKLGYKLGSTTHILSLAH